VLFAQQAGEVFKVLMEDCDVHTVLRCPNGTFSPYTEGTKTNVLFFTKGRATKSTWIYDARANVPKINKTKHPLTTSHFADFEHCYGDDPNGISKRREDDSPDGRWRSFTLSDIQDHHFKLDAFKWIRDEEFDDPDDLPEPEELVTEALEQLNLALDELTDMQRLLEEHGVAE
jgi:type I restriction enzyme M protein